MSNNINLKTRILITILCAFLSLQGVIFSISAAVPLRVTNITVSTTDKTATISFHTNEKAQGIIEFEYDKNFDSNNPTYRFHVGPKKDDTTGHSLTLYSLIPETTYHFRIHAISATQEVYSFDQYFETRDFNDTTAPDITRVRAEYVTGSTATIQWETNEKADSVIQYGTTESYGKTKSSRSDVVIHDLTITGLSTNTTYHFRVKSKDDENNTTISPDQTFKTAFTNEGKTKTLTISDIKPISSNDPDITANSAIISFRTNKLADCKILYGTSTRLGSSKSCSAPRSFEHTVNLANLKSGTRYYFELGSKDVFGKRAERENLSFVTKGSGPVNLNQNDDSASDSSDASLYASFDYGFDADSAAGSNQATNNGASLTSQNALSGDSLDISSGNYLTYKRSSNINSNKGTIAFWFRPNWSAGDNKNHTLLDLSKGNKYFFIDKAKNNKLRFWLENSKDKDFQDATYNVSGKINANQWYHVAITWDYAGGNAKLYLDGVSVASDSINGSPIPFNENIYLGGTAVDYVASKSANALIDELNTFGRVLSSSEIRDLADASNIGSNDSSGGGIILGASTLDYTATSGLYKSSENGRVYAIYPNGQKHYIASPSVFESYGYSWADVRTVPQSTIDSYRDAHLVTTPNNSKIHWLYTNKMLKIHIPSPTIFNSYPNNNWDDIIIISESDLNYYPDTQIVKDVDKDPKYYFIQKNTVRKIVSPTAYEDLSLSPQMYGDINYAHLNSYIIGDPI